MFWNKFESPSQQETYLIVRFVRVLGDFPLTDLVWTHLSLNSRYQGFSCSSKNLFNQSLLIRTDHLNQQVSPHKKLNFIFNVLSRGIFLRRWRRRCQRTPPLWFTPSTSPITRSTTKVTTFILQNRFFLHCFSLIPCSCSGLSLPPKPSPSS